MTTSPSIVRAALLAALSLAATASQATSTATSTLSGFRIALQDLDLGDGVAPSLLLDPLSRSTAVAGAVQPGASTFWTAQGPGAFDPVSVNGVFPGEATGGSASFAGDPFGAGATLTGSAFAASRWFIGLGETYIDSQPTGLDQFTLSAHTQVTFSGLAAVQWNASAAAAAATGEIDLRFFQILPSGESLLDRATFSAGYLPGGGSPQAGSASQFLAVTFSNTSDQAMLLDYDILVVAHASEIDVPPSPVDEPAAAWLLLAALAPAWFARRR